MHNQYKIKKKIVSKVMKSVVKYSYNMNDYVNIYRNRSVTHFEKQALDLFIEEIKKEKPRILDLGCGTGKPYDEYVVKKKCSITGIDFSKKHIEQAKKNIPEATFIYDDFMKYSDEFLYDGVMMLYSLFHIQRDEHKYLLKNIYNKLIPHGKVLLNVREKDSKKIKFKANFCGCPMLWSNYDYETFIDIVTEIGFKYLIIGNEKKFGSKEDHIWIILSKI